MLITLFSIRSQFSDLQTSVMGSESNIHLSSYEHLDPNLFDNQSHTLFLASQTSQLAKLDLQSDTHILFYSETEPDLSFIPSDDRKALLHILYVKSSDFKMIRKRIYSYFLRQNAYGHYAETLLNSLFFERGIQSIVNTAYDVFLNPIFVFDAGFHLIAATENVTREDSIYASLLENGGHSDFAYSFLKQHTAVHERVKNSEVPLIVHHKDVGFNQLICQIDNNKDMGHIVINGMQGEFTEDHIRFMLLLKEAINQQLKKEEFIRSSRGYPYEWFLRDLLDEKIVVDQQYIGRLEYIKSEFPGSHYCLVIEMAKTAHAVNPQIVRDELEAILPLSKSLIYQGEIILLFNLPDQQSMAQKELDSINAVCKKHGLFAGLSNEFSDILQVKAYRDQALRAIELGSNGQSDPGLFIYSNFFIQHMAVSFMQKESADIFCHPQMKNLFLYDKENRTELAYTLYTYLIHERNYKEAAESMFIHVNTLKYRIRNIEKMFPVNLSDANERRYLIHSYEMFKQ